VRDAWAADADLLALLEPAFEHFLGGEHWLVETYIPWAPLHPLLRRLAERVRVVHRGCSAGRDRLTVNPGGVLSPCVCLDVAEAGIGNVREHDLATIFASAALCEVFRKPGEHGVCADCSLLPSCGGGCRAAAFALTGSLRGEDGSCPVRRARANPDPRARQ
ncbi:MAG TPA: SPASM domain-containing protein, partial [Candidatus Methanoperedens sp.]|nr:SPASM domain-containing protein [Candidatus Methanoperedens sp.]